MKFACLVYRKEKAKRQKEREEIEKETKTISGSLTGTIRSMQSFGTVSNGAYDSDDGMEDIQF